MMHHLMIAIHAGKLSLAVSMMQLESLPLHYDITIIVNELYL